MESQAKTEIKSAQICHPDRHENHEADDPNDSQSPKQVGLPRLIAGIQVLAGEQLGTVQKPFQQVLELPP